MTKVLVADDDNDLRSILHSLLSDEGFQVMSVSDGQAVLHALSQESGWIIFLDLLMPVFTGYQVLERLHLDPSLQNQNKIILMSAAWHSEEEAQRFPGSVVQAVLRKPFDLDEALDMVWRFSP